MATREVDVDEAADVVRSRIVELNNAIEKAAALGLKIEIDVAALSRIGMVDAPMLTVEIFERR
jgi:hypothetical protein